MQFEVEQDDGNIEYKLKLLEKSEKRIENLATQLRYRCDEGEGECIYNLGVEDNGEAPGITENEYLETLDVLKKASEQNKYIIKLLEKTFIEDDKYVYEVLIREHNEQKYIDVKVAVAGNVDTGKSSLLGVLTSDTLDDGRGKSRISVFNFPHEVKTGRTSSVGHHILGYSDNGEVINYGASSHGIKMSWVDIVRRSSKIISFFDLCGHEKYLKTTILGLASSQPNLCLIIIGANKGIGSEKSKTIAQRKSRHENMTKEHMFLCIALGIPFAIVVTKIDMIKDQGIKNIYEKTMEEIQQIIKKTGIRRQPIKVKTEEDVLICAKQVHTQSIVPIFSISNVTGEGIDHLKSFFNLFNKPQVKSNNTHVQYHVDATWSVPGVGLVIGGHLVNGKINVNDKLWLGPNNNEYTPVVVRSIHCKRVALQTVSSGSYVCLGLKKVDIKNIRRGSVVISDVSQKKFISRFTANVKVMRAHATSIRVGFQPVIHVNSVRQVATIEKIENKINARNTVVQNDDLLRSGDTAIITFKFLIRPEFLAAGMRILCNDSRTKMIGSVDSVLK
jgi:GTPase